MRSASRSSQFDTRRAGAVACLPLRLRESAAVAPFTGLPEAHASHRRSVPPGRRCDTDVASSAGSAGSRRSSVVRGNAVRLPMTPRPPYTMAGVTAPLEIGWYSADGKRVSKEHMAPCPNRDQAHCPVYRSGRRLSHRARDARRLGSCGRPGALRVAVGAERVLFQLSHPVCRVAPDRTFEVIWYLLPVRQSTNLPLRPSRSAPRPWGPAAHRAARRRNGLMPESLRPYEVMIILDADLDEETIRAAVERWLTLIGVERTERGHVDWWGNAVSPDEINRKADGYYVVFQARSGAGADGRSCTGASLWQMRSSATRFFSILRGSTDLRRLGDPRRTATGSRHGNEPEQRHHRSETHRSRVARHVNRPADDDAWRRSEVRSWRNQQTQSGEERTSFFNVVAWAQLAENLPAPLQKRMRVVDGMAGTPQLGNRAGRQAIGRRDLVAE